MHLIMTTFAFLMIFSIFSYAQLQKLKENGMTESVYAGCFTQSINEMSKLLSDRADQALQKLSLNKSTPHSKGKLTSYLHISSLIQPDATPQITEASKTAKILLKGVIIALYGDKTFFLEAGMDEAKVDDFIATLFLHAKDFPTKNFTKKPQALANVPLNNKIYEGLLYKMLKGNTPPQDTTTAPLKNPENYKPLTDFIRFEKSSSMISVYIAPEETLAALFQDPAIIKEVIAARNKIYKEQLKEKSKNKNADPNAPPLQNTALDECKKEFEQFRESLVAGIDKNLIDFNISLTNPNTYSRDD